MAKRYDPIMCMMVDDSVKTEDRDPYAYEEIKKDIQIMKSGKASYITKNSIIGRISHSFNNRTITKEQKTELMNLVMSAQDAKKVLDSAKAQDELSLAQKKQVVTELKGYLKKSYNFSDESEYARAYEDLRHMFTTGSRKSISALFENTVKKTGAHDANTLYETFAHGNSKHAGVLEMNGKVKVVVWNEGDNPRTGKVTVIGEDTPANRSKAKSMLDSASTLDKAIKMCDASTGHKVVVFVENYLRSIGKNNSTGKYDKIVQGVRSLLSQSLLDDEGLKKAAEHEADRLLKKYSL